MQGDARVCEQLCRPRAAKQVRANELVPSIGALDCSHDHSCPGQSRAPGAATRHAAACVLATKHVHACAKRAASACIIAAGRLLQR